MLTKMVTIQQNPRQLLGPSEQHLLINQTAGYRKDVIDYVDEVHTHSELIRLNTVPFCAEEKNEVP